MKARAMTMLELLTRPVQYRVPVYQRNFEWEGREEVRHGEVGVLCGDIRKRCLDEKRTHFIGPVTIRLQDRQDGPTEIYDVIDGQQRMVTLIILLAIIRDWAREHDEVDSLKALQDRFLMNAEAPEEQKDRMRGSLINHDDQVLHGIVQGAPADHAMAGHGMVHARGTLVGFARQCLTRHGPFESYLHLAEEITGRLKVVCIELEEEDHPTFIFESLNNRGRGLAVSDLCRCSAFVRIPDEQDQITLFRRYWGDIERWVRESRDDAPSDVPSRVASMDRFMHAFAARHDPALHKRDLLPAIEQELDAYGGRAEVVIRRMHSLAKYYQALHQPIYAKHPEVQLQLTWLQYLDLPGLRAAELRLFEHTYERMRRAEDGLTEDELAQGLLLLESLMIRREVCGLGNEKLASHLSNIFKRADGRPPEEPFFERIKAGFTQAQVMPDDTAFSHSLREAPLYRSRQGKDLIRYMLFRLEWACYGPEERDLAPSVEDDDVQVQPVEDMPIPEGWMGCLATLRLARDVEGGEPKLRLEESLMKELASAQTFSTAAMPPPAPAIREVQADEASSAGGGIRRLTDEDILRELRPAVAPVRRSPGGRPIPPNFTPILPKPPGGAPATSSASESGQVKETPRQMINSEDARSAEHQELRRRSMAIAQRALRIWPTAGKMMAGTGQPQPQTQQTPAASGG